MERVETMTSVRSDANVNGVALLQLAQHDVERGGDASDEIFIECRRVAIHIDKHADTIRPKIDGSNNAVANGVQSIGLDGIRSNRIFVAGRMVSACLSM